MSPLERARLVSPAVLINALTLASSNELAMNLLAIPAANFGESPECELRLIGFLGSLLPTRKKFRKEGVRPLAIHWGFIGPCFAGGAWLDMYTLSLLGDRGAGGALGNSR